MDKQIITRRGLLAGILAACAAPAIVKASSIMTINPRQGLWVPPLKTRTITANWTLEELPDKLYDMEIGRIEGFRFVSEPYDALTEAEERAVHDIMEADTWLR
jgi:hypothetical protein